MSNILKTIKYKDNKYSINYNGSINDFIKQIKNKLQIIMIKKFIVHLEGFKNIEIDFDYLNNLEDLLKAPFFKYLEIISFENNNIIIEELKKEIQKLNTINQSLEFEIKSLKNDITMLKNEYDKFKDTHNEEIKKIYKLIEENINNTNKFNQKLKNNVDNIKDSYYNKNNDSFIANTNSKSSKNYNYGQSNSAYFRCQFKFLDNLSVPLQDIESKKIQFLTCQTRFKNIGQVNIKNIKIFSSEENNEPFYINEINLNKGNEIETNQVIKFKITIFFKENYKFEIGNYKLTLNVKNENGEIEAIDKEMEINIS